VCTVTVAAADAAVAVADAAAAVVAASMSCFTLGQRELLLAPAVCARSLLLLLMLPSLCRCC